MHLNAVHRERETPPAHFLSPLKNTVRKIAFFVLNLLSEILKETAVSLFSRLKFSERRARSIYKKVAAEIKETKNRKGLVLFVEQEIEKMKRGWLGVNRHNVQAIHRLELLATLLCSDEPVQELEQILTFS